MNLNVNQIICGLIKQDFKITLCNNYILVYFTHDEDKSVVTERFMRTLKVKIYKKMATNNSTSNLDYLKKLAEE